MPLQYTYGTQENPIITKTNKYNETEFGESRVANAYTLIDLINKYEIDAFNYGTQTATGGTVTHDANLASIKLQVTGTNGSSSKLRTNTFYRYQAGKEMIVKQTVFHTDTGQTNQVRRWGIFDDNDGLFWELSGTTLNIVKRTSTSGSVDNSYTIPKSSWNYDKMDGYGPSGMTLDITKGNIYEFHIAWLGVGVVDCFVNGYLVHTINNPNTIAAPYMKTAQLPLNWEIVNNNTSTTSSFYNICASIIIPGGSEPEGITFGAYNATVKSVTTTEIPILAIRPKATYNSITNRAVVFPFAASISTEGARISYRIIMNPTLTGASWVSVDANSTVEYDVSSTTFSGGNTLLTGFLGSSNDSNNSIFLDDFFKEQGRKLRQNAFATSTDILLITAVNEQTGTTSVKSSISWKEVR